MFLRKTVCGLLFLNTCYSCKTPGSRTPQYSDVASVAPDLYDKLKVDVSLGNMCANYKSYDIINAYLLAVHSQFSKLKPEDTFPILSTNYNPENIQYFISNWKNPYRFSDNYDAEPKKSHLTYLYPEHPLPIEFCFNNNFKHCIQELDSQKCKLPSKIGLKRENLPFYNSEEFEQMLQNVKNNKDVLQRRLDAVNLVSKLLDIKQIWDADSFIKEVESSRGTPNARNCDFYRQHDLLNLSDTEGMFVEGDDHVILSFKGTETQLVADKNNKYLSVVDLSLNGRDILTDLQTNFKHCGEISEKNPLGWTKGGDKVEIHDGFCKASVVAADWVKTQLAKVKPMVDPKTNTLKPKKLFLTGHSLGGAIASITQYALMLEKIRNPTWLENIDFGGLYTYGSPRVGNANFVKEYQELALKFLLPTYRLVNNGDIVPRAPYFGYYHLGELVWYYANRGTWTHNARDFIENMSDDHTDKNELKKLQVDLNTLNKFPYFYLFDDNLKYATTIQEKLGDHNLENYIERLKTSDPIISAVGRSQRQCDDKRKELDDSDFWQEFDRK